MATMEEKFETVTRIWVCSWNMAAKNHWKMIDRNGQKEPHPSEADKFDAFVPSNYDLYVFGVQEGIDESYFNLLSMYFKKKNIVRMPLNPKEDRVHGRGDGSFLSTKFTGIALYVANNRKNDIHVKKTAAISAGLMEGSKGAACVVVKTHGTTVCFLSTHLSSNSPQDKLVHYQTIIKNGGNKLGCPGFHLLEQFHHIIWFGDLNYRITNLPADRVLLHIATGNVDEIWKKDSLLNELSNGRVFYNFIEPKPRKDFYPTYKKKPNRQFDFARNPDDLKQASVASQETCLSLLDQTYRTKYKEPFYKGGTVQDRIPSFCDRLLFRSLESTSGQLVAEYDNGVLNCQQGLSFNDCNNYGCIPHNLMGSDHSAIYCGLNLKSPNLFPRPPNELDEHGNPLQYFIQIKNVLIVRGNYKFKQTNKNKNNNKDDNNNTKTKSKNNSNININNTNTGTTNNNSQKNYNDGNNNVNNNINNGSNQNINSMRNGNTNDKNYNHSIKRKNNDEMNGNGNYSNNTINTNRNNGNNLNNMNNTINSNNNVNGNNGNNNNNNNNNMNGNNYNYQGNRNNYNNLNGYNMVDQQQQGSIEWPTKMKFLFPAPFEIDCDYPKIIDSTVIYRNDLAAYHSVLDQIESESKNRITPVPPYQVPIDSDTKRAFEQTLQAVKQMKTPVKPGMANKDLDKDPFNMGSPRGLNASESSATPSPPGGAVIRPRDSAEWSQEGTPSMDAVLTSVNESKTPQKQKYEVAIERNAKHSNKRPVTKPPLPPLQQQQQQHQQQQQQQQPQRQSITSLQAMHELKVQEVESRMKKEKETSNENNGNMNESDKPHVPRQKPPPLGGRQPSSDAPNRPLPQLNEHPHKSSYTSDDESNTNSNHNSSKHKRPKRPVPSSPPPTRPHTDINQHSTPVTPNTLAKYRNDGNNNNNNDNMNQSNSSNSDSSDDIHGPGMIGMERGHSTPDQSLPNQSMPTIQHYHTHAAAAPISTQNNFFYKKKRNSSQNSSIGTEEPSMSNNLMNDYFVEDADGNVVPVSSIENDNMMDNDFVPSAIAPKVNSSKAGGTHLSMEVSASVIRKRKKHTMNDVTITRNPKNSNNSKYNNNMNNKNTNNNSKNNNNNNNTLLDSQAQERPSVSRIRSRSLTSLSPKLPIQELSAAHRAFVELKHHREKFTLFADNGRVRPTHGYVHMLLRVKAQDFEAQTVFPFRWSAFSRNEEGAKDGTLTQGGLPLSDPKTGKTIRVKIEYALGMRKAVPIVATR